MCVACLTRANKGDRWTDGHTDKGEEIHMCRQHAYAGNMNWYNNVQRNSFRYENDNNIIYWFYPQEIKTLHVYSTTCTMKFVHPSTVTALQHAPIIAVVLWNTEHNLHFISYYLYRNSTIPYPFEGMPFKMIISSLLSSLLQQADTQGSLLQRLSSVCCLCRWPHMFHWTLVLSLYSPAWILHHHRGNNCALNVLHWVTE